VSEPILNILVQVALIVFNPQHIIGFFIPNGLGNLGWAPIASTVTIHPATFN
jgi:hypothetical protein